MPLFQPSNITPSSFAGAGNNVVDVNTPIAITWQVNGNVPMTGFKIDIYLSNDRVGGTNGIIPTASPFYPTNNLGESQFYEYAPSQNWSDWGLQNNVQYTMTITQYWTVNTENDTLVEQRSQTAFITRATPSLDLDITMESIVLFNVLKDINKVGLSFVSNVQFVSNIQFDLSSYELSENDAIAIGTIPLGSESNSTSVYIRQSGEWSEIVGTRVAQGSGTDLVTGGYVNTNGFYPVTTTPIAYFSATYSQAQNDPINWVRWRIAMYDPITKKRGQYVFDTGTIYTTNLIVNIPPLVENNTYSIACTVETASGVQVSTGTTLLVFYQNNDVDIDITTTASSYDGSILLKISDPTNTLGSVSVYQKNQQDNVLSYLWKYSLQNTEGIKLFTQRSTIPYSLSFFGWRGDDIISKTTIENKTYCSNAYYLYITEKDESNSGVYHVVASWKFGNNISIGGISNNNAPNFLTNFTKYRLKQPTARMGKTGSLQALLSNVANGKYQDTALQMENLYAISQCRNPMFLKDPKGNLYMVTISAPISQTINVKSFEQRVTVSIPWEEIGSADGVSIIQTPNDQGWVGDNSMLQLVRFVVDPETGMLQVIYPDNYMGTTFALPQNSLLANTPNGITPPTIGINGGSVVVETGED